MGAMALGEALSTLVASIARISEPQMALDRVCSRARELTRSRNAFIAVLDAEAGHLVIRSAIGDDVDDELRKAPLPVYVGEAIGIASFVAATGQPFVSGDVKHEPRYRALFPRTSSEMAVPVRDRYGRVVAVLNLESDEMEAFSREQEEFVLTLGGVIALILEQETHERREEALLQVAMAITSAENEQDLIARILRVAEQVLRLQACSIFLIDPAADRFVLQGSSEALRDRVGQIAYSREEGFTGWVCHHKQPILLHSPQGDPRWRGKYVEIPSEQIASFLAVPIVSRGVGIGAIRILRRISENPYLDNRFNIDDQRLLQAIAEQIAVGLESNRSTERRIRDERMIAWGELSAKSSHMIGNRVFALKGDLNELGHVLSEGELDRREISELHRSLVVNVQRIEEVLHDFRDFVTATQIHVEPTDLNALVMETVEEVFPKRGPVMLELELDMKLPTALVDARRIRRAVSELIENSLVHTKEGHVRIVSCQQDNRLRIEVEDTGPGVPDDKKALIFQPFFSGRAKGMGLGLSIVQGIIAAHGGDVHEEGKAGEGARFVIQLPVGADHPS